MKILANILFERLHRYVYDYHYQSNNEAWGTRTLWKVANRNNKYRDWNDCISQFYNHIYTYFEGWRMSLRINLWWVKRYRRYEPEKLDLMDCEFEKLSRWNKFIYSIRYEFSYHLKTLREVKERLMVLHSPRAINGIWVTSL